MNILLIANDTNFIYNLRREIIERFIREGHKVTVVGEILDFEDEFRKIGAGLIDVKIGRHGTNPINDLKLLAQYRKISKKTSPDIVFTNNIKGNVYAGIACQMQKVKYVANICGLGTPLENGGYMQKLTVFLCKLGIKEASVAFFQNKENQKFFHDRKMLMPKTKAVLLPGSGVNLETHPLMSYPENGEIHFLYAARIMKPKGIDLFLEAARKFSSDKVIFDVCGQCDDSSYLNILDQEQKAGHIRYHGLQKDLTPFYRECSCFLYPSYYPEGMSNVLLEAAACGRPVITADRSGCREIVVDGVTGYITKVNDTKSVLNAVERFLELSNQKREQMGIAGRSKVENEFDRKLVVRKYIQVAERLVNRNDKETLVKV